MEKEFDYTIENKKTNKKKKTYSIMAFLNIMRNVFSSKKENEPVKSNISTNKDNTEKTELSLHIDKLLSLKMYDTYFKVLKEGYQPTSEQKNIFNNYVDNVIRTRNFSTLETMIKFSIDLENYQKRSLITVDFLSHDYSSVPLKNLESEEYPLLAKYLTNYINNPQFETDITNHLNRLFKNILSCKKSSEVASTKIVEFTYLVPKFKSFYFKNLNEIDFLTLIEQWSNFTNKAEFYSISDKNSCVKLNELIIEEFKNKHSNYEKNLINKTRNLYFKEHVEKYTKSITLNTLNSSINQLPENALQLIEDIKEIYNRISESDIQTKNISFFVEEKLPKIISVYLRMDEEYRDTLKSVDNLTPTELMIQSLTNIKEHLQNTLEEQLENDVRELSVIRRTTTFN